MAEVADKIAAEQQKIDEIAKNVTELEQTLKQCEMVKNEESKSSADTKLVPDQEGLTEGLAKDIMLVKQQEEQEDEDTSGIHKQYLKEIEDLKTDNEKHKYRIKMLLRTIEDLETKIAK